MEHASLSELTYGCSAKRRSTIWIRLAITFSIFMTALGCDPLALRTLLVEPKSMEYKASQSAVQPIDGEKLCTKVRDVADKYKMESIVVSQSSSCDEFRGPWTRIYVRQQDGMHIIILIEDFIGPAKPYNGFDVERDLLDILQTHYQISTSQATIGKWRSLRTELRPPSGD